MRNTGLNKSRTFSVAPMMDWTDRHCRYLHRQLSAHALLFTEMVTSPAVIHGDRPRLLGFDDSEHPVVVQLGGSDPAELADATRVCAGFGYDEINLNVGCPSDRVQSGRFGACLMAEPELVARCVEAMKAVTDLPVTVKCRIGIDDQDSDTALDLFANFMVDAGVDALYVHARKAWLQGLSPKENRDIPPLDYPLVYRLAERLSPYSVHLNGGILDIERTISHLEHVSGVMVGRVAYKDPMMLAEVDRRIYGSTTPDPTLEDVLDAMTEYAARETASGVRVNQITRHMLGLANGRPGARLFRQILSVDACKPGAGPEVISRAANALVEAGALSRIPAT